MKIKVNERVMIDRCPFTVTRCRVGRASVRLGVVPENASARALLGALHHALPREVVLCMADGAEHTMCVTGVSVQGVVGRGRALASEQIENGELYGRMDGVAG